MSRVFVGLSGGVDSAVSAALLKARGFDVVGAFIKIWSPEFIECTWREDRLDAMRVAAQLGIPFREIDLSAEYKRSVVELMVRSYEAGRTPNPDVLCNSAIKFGHFYDWAREAGADFVATGHYARTESGRLFRAHDTEKDQSYFLHQLSRETLVHTLFPIGDMEKSDVRRAAERFGLPNAKKPDSQGLCFVGDITLPEFLSHYTAPRPGAVHDETGTVIGSHEGAMLYTIGQRHGFTLERADAPHFVIGINAAENIITVSRDSRRAARTEAPLMMHWVDEPRALPFRCFVQTRYREMPCAATLEKKGEAIVARFETPHVFSPGQFLVAYEGDECVGGGEILNSSVVFTRAS